MATTRTSIRDELARLCGLDADETERAWISGVGPDRTAVELVARRLANRSSDVRQLRELDQRVRGVHTGEELAQRVDAFKEESYRTALRILDLERWRELLGDPLASADEKARVEFAVSLGKALNLAIKGASVRRTRAEHELRRTSVGLKALERLLEQAARGEDEVRP